jgi:hypothetical protein
MNKLEAIVLLTTSREINNGQFLTFCNQFRNMKYCGLKLLIFINNSHYDPDFLLFLSEINIFSMLEIVHINILPADDIYIRDFTQLEIKPIFGGASGPNILFFESIKQCYKFNTVLVLETDCILTINCFTVCKNYISGMSDFLIAGSKYLGVHGDYNIDTVMFNHLNGVAFYRTSHPEFQNLMLDVQTFIKSEVKEGRSSGYDYAIYNFISNKISTNENRIYYKYLLSKLVVTTFIINCSMPSDKNMSLTEIKQHFPNHVILHKKS